MTARVHRRYATVDGRRLFYREAGSADAPAVVLLHGFPTSSFMFRDLIPQLAGSYRQWDWPGSRARWALHPSGTS